MIKFRESADKSQSDAESERKPNTDYNRRSKLVISSPEERGRKKTLLGRKMYEAKSKKP